MVGPSKNSAEGNRLLKAVVLDLNNNQWGWEEVKKTKKNRKWSNPTVSDRCCRAECQLSGGLCVLSQVQRGSSLPACRLVLHLFPSSNVNVNLLFVHQTARRPAPRGGVVYATNYTAPVSASFSYGTRTKDASSAGEWIQLKSELPLSVLH